MRALYVLFSVTSRLGLVAAVLLVTRDGTQAAALAAFTTLLTAAAAWSRAELVGIETERAWHQLVEALRARPVRDLEIMREDEIGVLTLLDAVRETATLRSTLRADLVGGGIAVTALAAGVATKSVLALGLGVAAAAVVLAAMIPLQRRQYRASQRAFDALAPLSRDVRALIGGAAELRAQGAETPVAENARLAAVRVATAERVFARHGAIAGIVPAMLAVGVAVTPRHVIDRLAAGAGLFELVALGAALVATSVSLARTFEHRRRVEPFVRAFDKVVTPSFDARSSREGSPVAPFEHVELTGVSVTHAGGTVAPHALSFRLDAGGLVLLGPNGSGKSTAIRVVLGLVAPSSGEVVRTGGSQSPIAYLPQRPFFEPGESLAWHLEILGIARDASWLAAAFERMGFDATLARRGAAGDGLDLPMGSFSGGEKQRFLLARTLGRPAGIVVLDEPEAALDEDGRRRLSAWIQDVSRERAILLVAHDPSFVPDGFVRVTPACAPAR